MSESKPDSKLYRGPVTEICGSPKDRTGGSGTTYGGDSVGEKESAGVIETVTYVEPAGMGKPSGK